MAVAVFALRFGMSGRYIGGQVLRARHVKVRASSGVAKDACLSGYEADVRGMYATDHELDLSRFVILLEFVLLEYPELLLELCNVVLFLSL